LLDANLLIAADTSVTTGCTGEKTLMNRIKNFILKVQILKDTKGQDLIEYALMAGFVAVAAGAIMPGVSTSISTIFSKVASSMSSAAASS